MAELQLAVQSVVEDLIDSGAEVGVRVAVYVEGELVVDCVAGVDSREGMRLVSETPLHYLQCDQGCTC